LCERETSARRCSRTRYLGRGSSGHPFVLVLTGLFPRVYWKYVDRSYRYLLLEVGHLGPNVYLAATALGLGPCGIGAFVDDQPNRLLGFDGRDEATVYLLAIGPTAG
jgi:SagB-type dehydrogenase family enzyme